jgi:hypothetical protein
MRLGDPERECFEEEAFMESCRNRLSVPKADCWRKWWRLMGRNG